MSTAHPLTGELLCKDTSIGEFLRRFREGTETIFDVSKQAGTDGKDATVIKLESRRLLPEEFIPKLPPRLESPPRAHCFHDVIAFINWLKKNATDASTVLGNIEDLTFLAVVDEDKKDGLEIVSFKPMVHPLWKPWETLVLGKALDVLTFARFVMERRRHVVDPDGRELALLLSQLTAESKVTVARGVGKKCINGMMVETTIQGTRHEFPVNLPDTIVVEVPLFVGLDKVKIDIDLLIHSPDQESIVVVASAAALLEAKVTAFLEFTQQISDECPGVIGLGTVQTGEWKYIKP